MIKKLGLKDTFWVFATTLTISAYLHLQGGSQWSTFSFVAHAFFSGLIAYGINWVFFFVARRVQKGNATTRG